MLEIEEIFGLNGNNMPHINHKSVPFKSQISNISTTVENSSFFVTALSFRVSRVFVLV